MKYSELERLTRELRVLEREQKLDEVVYSKIKDENKLEYAFFLKELHKQIMDREKCIREIRHKIDVIKSN